MPWNGTGALEPNSEIPAFLLAGLEGLSDPTHTTGPPRTETASYRRTENSVIAFIAGPLAKEVALIWSGTRIGEYLSATDARRHLWHLWLSSDLVAFQMHNPMSAELAYTQLTYTRGKDLIAQATNTEPKGLVRALGRLGPTARPKKIYRALASIFADGGAGAKFIRHSSELSDELILGVATLPSGMSAKAILRLVKEGRVPAFGLGHFAWTWKRLEELKGLSAAQAILVAHDPAEALKDAALDLPFPRPPWPGCRLLRPVSSRDELRQIAQEFENCLRGSREQDSVLAVLNGTEFFYRWHGAEPALLLFRRFGPVGWYLVEALGPRNSTISDRTRSEITRQLSDAAPLCPVWDANLPIWRADRYLEETIHLPHL